MPRRRSLSLPNERSYNYPSHRRNRRTRSAAPTHLTDAQTNAILSTHHSAIYGAEDPTTPTNSEESWEYEGSDCDDSDYDNSDSDEEEMPPPRWYLRLPIYSGIALRRALTRGDDPFQVQRQQRSQLHHEMETRNGPLRNVNTTFREVDFGGEMQYRSRMARILSGEPISPRSLPRVDQMNLREYEEKYGVQDLGEDEEWMRQRTCGQRVREPFDLMDYTYLPTLSAPIEEGNFSENPFRGRPHSAMELDREVKGTWYDNL